MPSEPTQPGIYLSYRWRDAVAFLYLRQLLDLCRHGAPLIYDHDPVSDEALWMSQLSERLDRTAIMLVVIGENWPAPDCIQEHPLPDGAVDPVFFEIEYALAKKIHVLPILMGDAAMPAAPALPPSLHPLLERTPIRLRRGPPTEYFLPDDFPPFQEAVRQGLARTAAAPKSNQPHLGAMGRIFSISSMGDTGAAVALKTINLDGQTGAERFLAEAELLKKSFQNGQPEEAKTPPPPDQVAFTVYRPGAVAPGTWETLLAFAHLADPPASLERVRTEAARLLGEKMALYKAIDEDAAHAIPADTEITFVPNLPGLEFNPPRAHFFWKEDVHSQSFRFRAPEGSAGAVFEGSFDVYLGLQLIASLKLRIKSDALAAALPKGKDAPPVTALRQRIFPSYSRKDLEIVRTFQEIHKLSGNTYLLDIEHLRSGEVWREELREYIRSADFFQLFWSDHSMVSSECRREWEYALSLGRPGFIRPVYWKLPLAKDPAQGLPPAELKSLNFAFLGKFDPAKLPENEKPPASP